jgi:hypothetical protein
MSAHAISATLTLHVERAMTADKPTGEPQPPADDHDIVWAAVHRTAGLTLWRKISLPPCCRLARDAGGLSNERRERSTEPWT